ncbi:LysR family transcriptional regulator [Kiloniella spongiae]|uniref:LysR family transcriptional regulator n=1 Tax=Kiloniella spongiae TaxID=1489064 RepID=A0A0H2MQ96_9PROT|nr:LysR family transcriptional regulator [Kiloniella spongiae]KLN58870.1 LysR family transcriptional regulator [Kiloniella spongiae]
MQRSDLSMKWLEVFQSIAITGSMQATAKETGLTISTVSHHLRSLEQQLGVLLLNHKCRPMTLTPAGNIFLTYIDQALLLIRKARTEVTLGNMPEARHLRLGFIEDFESKIGPELAVFLAESMPNCDFIHSTRFSHEILEMLHKRKLDIGLANRPSDTSIDLQEFPILRDPFVLAIPAHSSLSSDEYLSDNTGLPFLRYSQHHIIGKQIEAQLRRLKIVLPNRFEIESNQTLMAMIAAGAGWSITTPLCYFRASHFHNQIKLCQFPEKSFARYLSLFATHECSTSIIEIINVALCNMINKKIVQPAYDTMPWLRDSFQLL